MANIVEGVNPAKKQVAPAKMKQKTPTKKLVKRASGKLIDVMIRRS
jgi:hypothetical protein